MRDLDLQHKRVTREKVRINGKSHLYSSRRIRPLIGCVRAKIRDGLKDGNLVGGMEDSGIDGVSAVRLLESNQDCSEFGAVAPGVRDLMKYGTNLGVNIAAQDPSVEDELAWDELRPLFVDQDVPIALPVSGVVAAVKSRLFGHGIKPMSLLGASAEYPGVEGGSGEVYLDVDIHGRSFFDKSRVVTGCSDVNLDTSLGSSDLAILVQGGLWRPVGERSVIKPIVLEIRGDQIDASAISHIATSAGITGQFAVRLVGDEDLTTRAISTWPNEEDTPIMNGEYDIDWLVRDYMATHISSGLWKGAGIRGASPYSSVGHYHTVGMKQRDENTVSGGHFVSASGRCFVAISPLKSVFEATYEV